MKEGASVGILARQVAILAKKVEREVTGMYQVAILIIPIGTNAVICHERASKALRQANG
jgi:hypothetical protein